MGEDKGWLRTKLQAIYGMEDRKYELMTSLIKKFIAECFGTAVLVFIGCLGVNRGLGNQNDHLGAAYTFGLAAFIGIQIGCHVSGGHINPAVTITGLFFKKTSIPLGIMYIVAQCIGGILGFGLIKLLVPGDKLDVEHFCVNRRNADVSVYQALGGEILLTTLLMLVVCAIWDPRNGDKHDSATLKFGFTIAALAYAGANLSGCSMNPARSLGPALWNNSWEDHWIFWLGPVLGASLTGFIYTYFFCPPIHPVVKSDIELENKA